MMTASARPAPAEALTFAKLAESIRTLGISTTHAATAFRRFGEALRSDMLPLPSLWPHPPREDREPPSKKQPAPEPERPERKIVV